MENIFVGKNIAVALLLLLGAGGIGGYALMPSSGEDQTVQIQTDANDAATLLSQSENANAPSQELALLAPLDDAPALETNADAQVSKKEEGGAAQAPLNAAAPTIDEFRREEDGMTIIAGRAEPSSILRIMIDGKEVAKTQADSSGGFAVIALLPPSAQPHLMNIEAELEGVTTASLDEIILTPAPALMASLSADNLDQQPTDAVAAATDMGLAAQTSDENLVVTDQEDQTIAAVEVVESATAALTELEQPTDAQVSSNTAQDGGVTPTQTVQENAAILDETTQTVAALETPLITTAPQVAATTTGLAFTNSAKSDALTTPRNEAAVVRPAQAKAPSQGALLKSNAQGVSLLRAPTPEVMANVALDTIGYSNAGEVQLAGRAQSEAVGVRVYLDNKAIIELPIDADGNWRGDLPDVDAGIYTLRVDEVAPDGAISSRVETPFKREAAEVLQAAVAKADGPIKAITVQKGATLWAIARERYGDGTFYLRVLEANASTIRNPDLIYPGQVFDLPN